ncbi:MAG TPA: MBL fold metallo-hydrolase [Syntrophomonadaceae bacterium]|nr:MBL fold metallo-hydrolase [Syntrophomonadaceae bacterium]
MYLVDGGTESALIDSGAGASADLILDNITGAGLDLALIKYVIITHGHIDHIGGLPVMKQRLTATIAAHELELPAVEQAIPKLTAASWYGVDYKGVRVDAVLRDPMEPIQVGALSLHFVHIPGHTVGGIAVYLDTDGRRVLFGQDIHGPFNSDWGSDISQWKLSMHKLLELKADILCEGHFGIYTPAAEVEKYITGYLERFGDK